MHKSLVSYCKRKGDDSSALFFSSDKRKPITSSAHQSTPDSRRSVKDPPDLNGPWMRHRFSRRKRRRFFRSFISAPGFAACCRPGERRSAASPAHSASISSSLSVLATGRHSQQSSFVGSSIINEESKAPDDCDYLLGLGLIPADTRLRWTPY